MKKKNFQNRLGRGRKTCRGLLGSSLSISLPSFPCFPLSGQIRAALKPTQSAWPLENSPDQRL